MPQYKTYSSGTTRTFKNGLYEFRRQNRGGKFCIDYNLSSTGFAGTENIDWKNASKSTCPGSLGIYREGIRDNGYVLDSTLTPAGFLGVKDSDWKNLIH